MSHDIPPDHEKPSRNKRLGNFLGKSASSLEVNYKPVETPAFRVGFDLNEGDIRLVIVGRLDEGPFMAQRFKSDFSSDRRNRMCIVATKSVRDERTTLIRSVMFGPDGREYGLRFSTMDDTMPQLVDSMPIGDASLDSIDMHPTHVHRIKNGEWMVNVDGYVGFDDYFDNKPDKEVLNMNPLPNDDARLSQIKAVYETTRLLVNQLS